MSAWSQLARPFSPTKSGARIGISVGSLVLPWRQLWTAILLCEIRGRTALATEQSASSLHRVRRVESQVAGALDGDCPEYKSSTPSGDSSGRANSATNALRRDWLSLLGLAALLRLMVRE